MSTLDKIYNIGGRKDISRKPAIYCRVSSSGQKQKGYLDTQVEVCKDYCLSKYKCSTPHMFVECAGAWGYRPIYYDMLCKLYDGRFSVVIASYKDRCGRSPAILRYQEHIAKMAHTKIDYINSSEEDTNIVAREDGVQELISYITHISNSQAGKRSAKSRAVNLSSELLKRAYELKVQGISTRKIVTILEQENLRDDKGGIVKRPTLDCQLRKYWDSLTALWGGVSSRNSFDIFCEEYIKLNLSNKTSIRRATILLKYEEWAKENNLYMVSYSTVSRKFSSMGVKSKIAKDRSIIYYGISMLKDGGGK